MWNILAKAADYLFKLSPEWQKYQKIKIEFASVKKERDDFAKKFRVKEGLVFRDSLYWDDSNSENPGPFCPLCVDFGRSRIHLMGSDEKGWKCEECEKYFPTPKSEELESQALDEFNRRIRQENEEF